MMANLLAHSLCHSLDVHLAYSHTLRNPLHPEHTDHEDHHDQFDTRSHVDHEHPHTHEEEVLLRFFGHQFPDSQGHPNKHNLESCTSLHAETEENLYAIRRLLNSVYSLIEGLEWFVVFPSSLQKANALLQVKRSKTPVACA
jgi:hypothetical protein